MCLIADHIKGSLCGNSSCSLNSENPYATIRDPPGPACQHTESGYVEMKSPSHREVPFGGTATLLGSAGRNVYDVGECGLGWGSPWWTRGEVFSINISCEWRMVRPLCPVWPSAPSGLRNRKWALPL